MALKIVLRKKCLFWKQEPVTLIMVGTEDLMVRVKKKKSLPSWN